LTKSKASHVFVIYYSNTLKKEMVMEATLKEFRSVPFEKWKRKNTIIALIETKYSTESLPEALSDYLGDSYDIGGLIGFLWVLVGRWVKMKVHNPWNSASSVFCSEAIVQSLQKINYPKSNELIAKDTSPDDLMKFVSE
jgi:ubiquinone biosynthesis protein COQ9